jgi:hypothetical protein
MSKILLCMFALFSATSFADTLSVIDPNKLPLLLAGDIPYEYTRRDEPGGSIRLEILVRADVSELWSILTGCGKAFIFVDGLEQCDILEQTQSHAIIHQVTDPGILVPVQEYTYKSSFQPFTRMDFDMVSGTMKAIDGSWQFVNIADGVVVIYNMHVQPSLPVPRFLVRMSIRNNMRDMLACIRGLVDGSGSSQKRQQDLQRCPGELGSIE